MSVVTLQGIAGPSGSTAAFQTATTRIARAGGPDGTGNMGKTIVGTNGVSVGVGGSGALDPHYFMAETMYGRELAWDYSFDSNAMFDQAATTDGALPGKFFEVLTNSGTATRTSSQSGYEGKGVSTTGAVSGNTNSWLAYDAGLPVANRHYWITQSIYVPAEATASLFDIWLGFTNKPGTASPPSAVVDGAWITCIGANGTFTISGNNANNSTAAATATKVITAAQSIQLAVIHQGQVGTDFYYRIPATPPTFVSSDKWVLLGSLSAAANLPRTTAVLRPYMAHIARSTAAGVLNMESYRYGIAKQQLR